MVNETYLKVEQVAKSMGKSAQTIRRWINKGVRGKCLAATKTGSDFKINPASLQNFLFETSK